LTSTERFGAVSWLPVAGSGSTSCCCMSDSTWGCVAVSVFSVRSCLRRTHDPSFAAPHVVAAQAAECAAPLRAGTIRNGQVFNYDVNLRQTSASQFQSVQRRLIHHSCAHGPRGPSHLLSPLLRAPTFVLSVFRHRQPY